MTNQLGDIVGSLLDRLGEMPRCIGCTPDDLLDEFEAGRVRAIRLNNEPVDPVYIHDAREGTTDE